eukprot:191280-Prymnesium_polylepis.1
MSTESLSEHTRKKSGEELELASLHFDKNMPLSVIIFGATGDLARKKLFPALYQVMAAPSLVV